ncbi:MAG: hypothetical protein MK212_21165 [Saprospiraceae bacterium]|nr:hypothetical protein [Saprospiraceae bacterium]
MSNPIDFTFAEINALNKLMGSIKGEAYLDADEQGRAEYCDLVFAPFKPTDKQRNTVIEALEAIAKEK